MRKAKPIILLVLTLLVLGAGTLFYIQNMEQRTPLYFNLGFWGIQMEDRVAVPMLMYISFFAGMAVMGVYTIIQRFRSDGRSRRSDRHADEFRPGSDDLDHYEF